MATVSVRQPHSLSPAEVRSRLSAFEEMMGKYGVSARWSGDRAKLEGTGVSGDIAVGAGEVSVRLKLGMLARAAGVDPKRLEASIAKRLKAAVGD